MSDPKQLGEILAKHSASEGALLPILRDMQVSFGHISEDAVRVIAIALNLSRAEVHGVVSFYHPATQANVVTTELSDWTANCPEYKVTAVQVVPSNGPSDWQRD